jgi:hypothetical protein
MKSSFTSVFLLFAVAACGGGGASDTTSASDDATNADEATDVDDDVDTDVDTDADTEGGECSNCPDGTSCVDGMCVPLGCDEGCPGLSYCDLATQMCQPGCALDSQCENASCDLATHSCVCDEGFAECGGECIPDDQICDSVCGNDQLDPNEVCDGDALNGASCESLGFFTGTLACLPDCSDYDTSDCVNPGCGDGTIHEGEECDGADLGGMSCADLGFDFGNVDCSPNCTFDTSDCGLTPQPEEGLFGECMVDFVDCVWDCAFDSFCSLPCQDDSDCAVPNLGGNVEGACLDNVQTMDMSRFCMMPCAGGLNCPGGMACTDTMQFGEICI